MYADHVAPTGRGGGAILYSAGLDLKDDGGRPLGGKKRTGDVIFRLMLKVYCHRSYCSIHGRIFHTEDFDPLAPIISYICSSVSIPSISRPVLIVRAVRRQSIRRLVRAAGSSALRTGQAS